MNKLIVFFLIIMLLSACHNRDKQGETESLQRIKIEADSIKSGNVFDYLELKDVVILENTKYSLISEPIWIKEYKDKLYIKDEGRKKILIFNNKGKLINAIPKEGKGPGEGNLEDMCVDYHKNQIVISVNEKKILNYDLDGNFINEINIGEYAHNIAVLDNKTFSILNFHYIEKKLVKIINRKGTLENEYYEKDNRFFKSLGMQPLTSNKYSVFYTEPLNDTVYRIEKEKMEPYLLVDFGNKVFSREQYQKEGIKQPPPFAPVVPSKYMHGISLFSENDKAIAFSFIYNKRINYYTYNKDEDISFVSSTLFFGHMNAQLYLRMCGISKTGELITAMFLENIENHKSMMKNHIRRTNISKDKKEALLQKIDIVDENDNPMICYWKIK